jgi:hypothetical protein
MPLTPSPFSRAATAFVPGLVTSPATTAPITLYVNAATGSDSNDGLTAGTPLLTVQAARAKIPNNCVHNVTLNIAPGTYTGPYDLTGLTIAPTVLVQVVGAMTAPTLTTGTTTGTVGTVTALSGAATPQSFVDLTQTWTVNELRGKWVSINGSTTYRMIGANTATSITLVSSGTVTAGQSYAILSPSVTLTSSTAGSPTVNAQNNFTGVATLLFTALNISSSGSATGSFVSQSGFSICRYVALSTTCAAVRTVQCNEGSLSLGTCFGSNFGSSGFPVLACGSTTGAADVVNVGGSYFQQNLGTGGPCVDVAACQTFFAAGAWVERLGTAAGTLMRVSACNRGSIGSGTAPIVLLAPAGHAGPGLTMGQEAANGGGFVSCSILNFSATNFGTAILAQHGARAPVLGTSVVISSCTTGFSSVLGATLRIASATPTFTGVTNELNVDGTNYTFANLLAASPLLVLSNAQTFASIGRY